VARLRGEFAGHAPTGRSVALRGCGFFHVTDGKIRELSNPGSLVQAGGMSGHSRSETPSFGTCWRLLRVRAMRLSPNTGEGRQTYWVRSSLCFYCFCSLIIGDQSD
jgi:hypothetical protein